VYIFDTNGRIIFQNKGVELGADVTVRWDGETSYGEVVENGLYLVRVVEGARFGKSKVLVIKK